MRDELISRMLRRASGAYDYFKWEDTPVRVSCAEGVSQTYDGETWCDDGPSYTVRIEECDELSEEQFQAYFPDVPLH